MIGQQTWVKQEQKGIESCRNGSFGLSNHLQALECSSAILV